MKHPMRELERLVQGEKEVLLEQQALIQDISTCVSSFQLWMGPLVNEAVQLLPPLELDPSTNANSDHHSDHTYLSHPSKHSRQGLDADAHDPNAPDSDYTPTQGGGHTKRKCEISSSHSMHSL